LSVLLKKLFDFFLFTSLFIACCAVLMVYQTALLFELQLPLTFYAFVFSGTVCSYNFHWFLTPPEIDKPTSKLRWSLTNRPVHFWLFVVALIASGALTILLFRYWLYLAMSAVLTFLYSAPMINHPLTVRLRSIAIGKTIFLAFAWMHVTTLLPLLIADALSLQHILFAVNRLFFLYAICIAFDRRDVEKDRQAGIKSLITHLSLKAVDRLFWFSLLVSFITMIWLWKWLAVIDIVCLLLPILLMGLLYDRSKSTKSDYFYYFLLDGLMALSAPLLILAKFAR
jgi:4-hydroxybenzoate polyprenyltransferase